MGTITVPSTPYSLIVVPTRRWSIIACRHTANLVGPADGAYVTITFKTSVNTLGYDITKIVSLTGYTADSRVQQKYDVSVEAVGSSTWNTLYSTAALGTAAIGENCVTIQDSGMSGAVLSN